MRRVEIARLPRGTTFGRRVGLLGAGILLAGFNTGNNLYYLVFTVLAAAEFAGFLLARLTLAGLEGELVLPRRGHAQAPLRATLRVRNANARWPVPALRWTIALPGGAELVVKTPALAGGASATGTGHATPRERGWLAPAVAQAASAFPLGLAAAALRLDVGGARTLVAPALLGRATGLETGDERGAAPRAQATAGAGEEPGDAREYRPGDDARGIDWKATARSERLVWRERRAEPPRAEIVRLDRRGPAGPAFESRVARAATRAARALARGTATGFESDELVLPARGGAAQRAAILDYLALVAPANVADAAPADIAPPDVAPADVAAAGSAPVNRHRAGAR